MIKCYSLVSFVRYGFRVVFEPALMLSPYILGSIEEFGNREFRQAQIPRKIYGVTVIDNLNSGTCSLVCRAILV
jgi:hypothetical protein